MNLAEKYPSIQWELTGIDPKVYAEIAPAFESQVQKYPILLEQLTYVGMSKPLGSKTSALTHVWNPVTTTDDYTYIYLNPYYYNNYARFAAEAVKSEKNHFHPTGASTIADSFIHELGHILMQALRSRNDVSLVPYVGLDGFGLVGPTLDLWVQSNAVGDSLSDYAKTSPNEAWAEGFDAIERGSPLIPYTASQSKLIQWLTGTKWHTEWRYAASSSEKDHLAQLAREYQIHRMQEENMYQDIRAEMAQTRKELSEGKHVAEKMGGGDDAATLFSQLHALLAQLESKLGGGQTDPSLSGCRIGASQWKEFTESASKETAKKEKV